MTAETPQAHKFYGVLPAVKFLRTSNLVKGFGAKEVLKGVDLALDEGGTTAIVGPLGSDRTTLLRLIAGFEVPDAGTIEVNNQTVAGNSWVPAHRREIGYVAQNGALFPHLTVAQDIGFWQDHAWRPVGRAAHAKRVAELPDTVSLESAIGERRPHELSGGVARRVLQSGTFPAPWTGRWPGRRHVPAGRPEPVDDPRFDVPFGPTLDRQIGSGGTRLGEAALQVDRHASGGLNAAAAPTG